MAMFGWLKDFEFNKGNVTLGGVADSLNDQLGYNDNNSLTPIDYSSLGDFTNRINKSAVRSYVETGTIRNLKPSYAEVLHQQPDITAVVKKRMFSSLVDNYRPDLMDSGDRNFYKASKRLFQNKCNLLAIYERLTKIDKIYQNKGVLDDYLLPLVSSGIDLLSSFVPSIVDSKTKSVLDTMKKLNAYSEPSNFMTWVTDPTYPNVYGEGTGVFDLTLVSNLNVSSSIQFNGGGGSITIENPYGLFSIKEEDIEQAISDTYSAFTGQSLLYQFSKSELLKLTEDLKYELNSSRIQNGKSGITIKINDDAFLNKKVRAFFDDGREIFFNYDAGLLGIGDNVDFDPSMKSGKNGLNNYEEDLLSRILKNNYQLINMTRQEENSKYKTNNDEIDHVRERMNLHFKNKNIIQSMDTIHIYISSKSKLDDTVRGIDNSSNYGTSHNILNLLNSTSQNLEIGLDSLKSVFGGNQNNYIEIEKNAIVGAEFPMWLWQITRNSFTRQTAGIHVFAGLVDNVSESFNNGKYTLSATLLDNTYYFRQGQVNFKPAADVIDREIYDPLTPFDLSFDPSTGAITDETPDLLPENKKLLESGYVKFNNGSKFLGSPISQLTYNVGDINKPINGNTNIKKVFFDPDGFVYRWKKGIGTFTYSGPRHPKNPIREYTSPSMTQNSFAGQDVMNILSLLITGAPYNFNTFIKNAVEVGNLSFNSNNATKYDNVEVARSFYRSLISDLQINNAIWGNFVPFKKLDVTEKGLGFLIQNQYSLQKSQSDLQQLLDKRAKYIDLLLVKDTNYANDPRIWTSGAAGSSTSYITQEDEQIFQSVANINLQIANQKQDILRTINDINLSDASQGTIKIFGNDMSFDPGVTGSEDENNRSRDLFRKKIKYLTQRRLWKVKANEDINLLIIDDQYDKDYDIQVFEQKISANIDKIKSEYVNVADQITQTSSLINLEVFADSQGHIQVRPPAYNKVPSSIFYKLIRSKKRLYPKQLESMFINQSTNLIDNLEIIEDEIRLRAAALGYKTDIEVERMLSGGTGIDLSGNYSFAFITDESDNKNTEKRPSVIKRLISQNNVEDRSDSEKLPLKNFYNSINGQLKKQGLFTFSAQVQISFDPNVLTINSSADDRYEEIRDRLSRKQGFKAPSKNELISNVRSFGNNRTQSDILKLTREISTFVQERQNVIKTLSNSIKNIEESYAINDDPATSSSLLFPSLDNKTAIPELIAHMIEDEEEDDLGPGSGSRYIIKDYQILSMTISETPPRFTTVEVHGLYGKGLTEGPNLNLNSGGNVMVSAIGVDYDLWQMYGFKVAQAIPAPFISDADTQAAPYAQWHLTEQRRNIIHGNCQITGNEYMQVGEVVYIESKDLLFYIEKVEHSIDYNGSFTTTLTLTYGHNPGEYIPTMIDIIGKGLYASRFKSNISNIRNGSASGDQPLGAIIIDPSISELSLGYTDIEKVVKGTFGEYNRKTLSNLIISFKNSQVNNSDVKPIIEARIYYNSKKGIGSSAYLASCISGIKEWLKSPSHGVISDDKLLPDSSTESLRLDLGPKNDELFQTVTIDVTDPQSPSTQAIAAARNSINKNPSIFENISGSSSEESALYNGIIDIWLKFESKPKVKETTTADIVSSDNSDPAQKQAEADIEAQKEADRNAYLQSQLQ